MRHIGVVEVVVDVAVVACSERKGFVHLPLGVRGPKTRIDIAAHDAQTVFDRLGDKRAGAVFNRARGFKPALLREREYLQVDPACQRLAGGLHALHGTLPDVAVHLAVGPGACGAVCQTHFKRAACPLGNVVHREVRFKLAHSPNGGVQVYRGHCISRPLAGKRLVQMHMGINETWRDQAALRVPDGAGLAGGSSGSVFKHVSDATLGHRDAPAARPSRQDGVADRPGRVQGVRHGLQSF